MAPCENLEHRSRERTSQTPCTAARNEVLPVLFSPTRRVSGARRAVLSLVEATEIPQPDLPELTEAHDRPLSPRVRPKIYQPKRLHPLGPHRVELPNPRRFRFQVAVELSEARAPRGDIRLPLALLFLAELHD